MDEKTSNMTSMENKVGKEVDKTPGTPRHKGASGGPGGAGGVPWHQGMMG